MHFIKIWIDKGYITPAVARGLEIGIMSGGTFLLAVLSGELIFSWQALGLAMSAPILAYITKAHRDKVKK